MLFFAKAGSTSRTARVFLQDSSATTGVGLTGLAFGSSGLKWSYVRSDQATATVVTPVTATVGTWTSAGFKEVDATNLPGMYEIGIPNAALLSGTNVEMLIFGATNLAPCPVTIMLAVVDPQTTTFGLALAKGTNLTGLNDIAATAIVSAGAITTSSGAVSTVNTVVNGVTASTVSDKTGYSLLVNPPTVNAIATAVWQDLTVGSDFSTVGSVGALLKANVVTVGAYSTGQDPATLVLDASASGHNTASSIGAKINAAGTASDPWGTALPGAYSSGTAGYVLGTNLNATVTSRVPATGGTVALVPTGLDAIALPTLTGPATTFPGMVVQTWRRFFKKTTRASNLIKTFADDGTTQVTSQAATDDGVTQTQGAAT